MRLNTNERVNTYGINGIFFCKYYILMQAATVTLFRKAQYAFRSCKIYVTVARNGGFTPHLNPADNVSNAKCLCPALSSQQQRGQRSSHGWANVLEWHVSGTRGIRPVFWNINGGENSSSSTLRKTMFPRTGSLPPRGMLLKVKDNRFGPVCGGGYCVSDHSQCHLSQAIQFVTRA